MNILPLIFLIAATLLFFDSHRRTDSAFREFELAPWGAHGATLPGQIFSSVYSFRCCTGMRPYWTSADNAGGYTLQDSATVGRGLMEPRLIPSSAGGSRDSRCGFPARGRGAALIDSAKRNYPNCRPEQPESSQSPGLWDSLPLRLDRLRTSRPPIPKVSQHVGTVHGDRAPGTLLNYWNNLDRLFLNSGNSTMSPTALLGGEDFVDTVLREADKRMRRQLRVRRNQSWVAEVIVICRQIGVSARELKAGSRGCRCRRFEPCWHIGYWQSSDCLCRKLFANCGSLSAIAKGSQYCQTE